MQTSGGLNRLRKNRQDCHPEKPQATKDLCICLKIQMQGSFASLRMTASERFSAASQVEPGRVARQGRCGNPA